MIRNINEALGDPVLTDSVESLARDIIPESWILGTKPSPQS